MDIDFKPDYRPINQISNIDDLDLEGVVKISYDDDIR